MQIHQQSLQKEKKHEHQQSFQKDNQASDQQVQQNNQISISTEEIQQESLTDIRDMIKSQQQISSLYPNQENKPPQKKKKEKIVKLSKCQKIKIFLSLLFILFFLSGFCYLTFKKLHDSKPNNPIDNRLTVDQNNPINKMNIKSLIDQNNNKVKLNDKKTVINQKEKTNFKETSLNRQIKKNITKGSELASEKLQNSNQVSSSKKVDIVKPQPIKNQILPKNKTQILPEIKTQILPEIKNQILPEIKAKDLNNQNISNQTTKKKTQSLQQAKQQFKIQQNYRQKTYSNYSKQIEDYVFIGTKNKLSQKVSTALKYWKMTSNNISQSKQLKQFEQQQKKYFQDHYKIDKYGELQMCVLVFSYNNQANNRYKRNLDSIFQQDYTNYKVYFIDDKSTDNTSQLVQQYIKNNKLQKKIQIIQNQVNKGKAQNQFNVAKQFCKPGSLMVGVDGDDQLIGKQVFKFLSAVYQESGLYFIYAHSLVIYQKKKMVMTGYSRRIAPSLIKAHNYRGKHLPSHLRTWMTDLFLDINKEDVMYQGDFPKTGQDCAYLFTLMEKAGDKVGFYEQFVYRYVSETGLNDYQTKGGEQRKVLAYFSRSKRFPVYEKPIILSVKTLEQIQKQKSLN